MNNFLFASRKLFFFQKSKEFDHNNARLESSVDTLKALDKKLRRDAEEARELIRMKSELTDQVQSILTDISDMQMKINSTRSLVKEILGAKLDSLDVKKVYV